MRLVLHILRSSCSHLYGRTQWRLQKVPRTGSARGYKMQILPAPVPGYGNFVYEYLNGSTEIIRGRRLSLCCRVVNPAEPSLEIPVVIGAQIIDFRLAQYFQQQIPAGPQNRIEYSGYCF